MVDFPWFENAGFPEFADCTDCRAHLTALHDKYGAFVTGMSFIMVAVRKDLSPTATVFEYFSGLHAEGHPELDDMPEPMFSGVVDRVRARVEPHPFVHPLIRGATSEYCARGALEGSEQFCGRGARDTIHSHVCPRCQFRGWVWTADGKPYCGPCQLTHDEVE